MPDKHDGVSIAGRARKSRIIIGAAVGLLAILAIVALYFAGTRMTPATAEQPTPAPADSEEPAPAEELLGPVEPGVYSWDALLGTECLEPFESDWESEYTVVDCGVDHSAQLVLRGRFDDEKAAPYPGVEELAGRTNVACASTDVIDYTAAAAYNDLQVSASYAASEADWAAGQRDFFCFVTRMDAAPLSSTIALPDRLITAAPADAAGE